MRNMVPARALVRRSRNLALLAILLIVLGILAIIMSSFMNAVPLVVSDNPNYGFYQFAITAFLWLGIILILISLVMFIRVFTWKRDNPVAEQVGTILESELNLDDRYAYIRNLSRFSIYK